jgi:hypothetical protein
MKPHTEMNEGPGALQRFEDTMKALFTARKVAPTAEKSKPRKPSGKKQNKRGA